MVKQPYFNQGRCKGKGYCPQSPCPYSCAYFVPLESQKIWKNPDTNDIFFKKEQLKAGKKVTM